MGLHLEFSEFQVAIKWWLSIPVAQGQSCSQCNAALDAYGHHALCCKLGGDVASRHNRLRDIFNDFYHSACLAPQLEMGGWSREHTRPAEVLVPNWVLGKPAAFELSVTSTLNAQIFQEACVTAGSAALAAHIRKQSNCVLDQHNFCHYPFRFLSNLQYERSYCNYVICTISLSNSLWIMNTNKSKLKILLNFSKQDIFVML